jgi:hypothetical protein
VRGRGQTQRGVEQGPLQEQDAGAQALAGLDGIAAAVQRVGARAHRCGEESEINQGYQTFMRAIQGSGIKANHSDAASAVDDLRESISSVKEILDLLGQETLDFLGQLLAGVDPVEEVTDEDLENEFMEFTALETITEDRHAVPE